jgi:FkbM family methyltransferase
MLGSLTGGLRSWKCGGVALGSALAAIGARRRRARGLRFYRRFIPGGGLCFDIGANMGDRTELFLALGAQVVAIEPQARCAEALHRRFGDRVEVVEAAVGPEPGEAELLVASFHTLSSLSREWVNAVRASGRFAEFVWDEAAIVPMTTLDELIRRFGIPDFCKIDVEGFELEVLRGLAQPLPALAFEFTFERIDARLAAVEHIASLGMTRFNFSDGESLEFALGDWVGSHQIATFLAEMPKRTDVFGDVYAAL